MGCCGFLLLDSVENSVWKSSVGIMVEMVFGIILCYVSVLYSCPLISIQRLASTHKLLGKFSGILKCVLIELHDALSSTSVSVTLVLLALIS